MSGEYLNQFVTTCRNCGKQIVMTQTQDGRWIPCNPVMIRFKPSGGPKTFVTHDGELHRGYIAQDGQLGYVRHREAVM